MLKFIFGIFLISFGFARTIFSDPVWGLYLFAALSHIRLTQLNGTYDLPTHVPITIASLCLLIYLIHPNYKEKFSKWPLESWLLGLMVLGMCVSSSQAIYNPELSWRFTYDFFKYWIFFIMLVQMIDTIWKVEWFHRVLILSAAWLVYLCWDLRGTTGPRFENIGGGYVADANHFAAALVFLFPFAFQKLFHKDKRIALGALILCFGIVMAILISGSRGGFLGLVALFIMLIITYKEQRKKLLLIACGLAFAGFIFMNPYQKERITTIIDYQQGSELDKSTELRLENWKLSWQLFTRNPLWGVGLGNFPYYSGPEVEGLPEGTRGHVAHSIWLEILAEGGLVTFVPFVLLLISFLVRCKRILSQYKEVYQNEKFYVYTILISMGGFFVCATFLNRIIYEPIYWSISLAVIHEYIQKKQLGMT
jgi:O-antigen ligase